MMKNASRMPTMPVTTAASSALRVAAADARCALATAVSASCRSESSGVTTPGSLRLTASIPSVSASEAAPVVTWTLLERARERGAGGLCARNQRALRGAGAVETCDEPIERRGLLLHLGEQLRRRNDEVLVHGLTLAPEHRGRLLCDERAAIGAAACVRALPSARSGRTPP